MLFRHDREKGGQAPPKTALETAGEAAAPNGFVVERPPAGPARGKYPTSPLVIGALGSALVLGTLLYFFLRWRKPRS